MIESLDLNDRYHRHIFNGKFLTLGSRKENEYYKTLDPVNEYKVDKHGFRSEIDSADILIGGCSYTFGLGVPADATWGSFVGKKLNSSTASLAIPGASIVKVVEQIYAYFREYGHPKKLLCLFPDLGRMPVMVDGDILSEGQSGSNEGDGLNTVHALNKYYEEAPKYLKKPYPVTYTTTYDNAAFWSIRHIRALEQYCDAVGIEFIWSTWDRMFSNIANELQDNEDFKFSSYFNIYESLFRFDKQYKGVDKEIIFSSIEKYEDCVGQHGNIDCSCELDCHSELIDVYGSENFHLGTDTARGVEYAHPGIHLHVHYAEEFLKQLERLKG